MSIKVEKIEQTIMREISDILRTEASDKLLQEITVTDIEVSNDLSHAKIYYTVLNSDDLNAIEKAIGNALGFVRSELAQRIELRKVPELKFIHDTSIEYAERIDKVIKEMSSQE